MLLGLISFGHSRWSTVPVLDETPATEADRGMNWEVRWVWQVLPFKKEGGYL